MISASTSLKELFKTSTSISTNVGCTVEYNMNTMTDLTDSSVSSSLYWESKPGIFPFKKLFPIDSIIKPFRPNKAGIKYSIYGDMPENTYDPKNTTFPLNYRIYYPGVDTTYKYWISKEDDPAPYVAITYPKDIIANKIVIKFEIAHSTPVSWTVSATSSGVTNLSLATTLKSGTSSDIPSFSNTQNAGVLNLYYTGTTWTTDESLHNTSAQQTIRAIKLSMGQTNGYIGVIELSPRWVKDISETISSLNIKKESSSSNDDIVPVGYVSANSLTMDISKLNSSDMEILSYKSASTYAIDPSKIYMNRNAELKPYIKVFHSNGSLGSTGNKYDIIYQGKYMIDSWSTTEFNEISITALDGAKQLQETIAPPILCKDYSMTAIIRQLLDSIGFTSYNFNLTSTDKSIISTNFWWTSDNITVWQAIQEICRDTQMTAVFDENGILQFYSREYMYNSAQESQWTFTSELVDSYLPNIESLSKNDIPVANQIKILWEASTTSAYGGDKDPLWTAAPTYLTAAGLTADLPSSATTGSFISLQPISVQSDLDPKVILSFTGFLAINDEIIEYDGIEYQYSPLSGGQTVKVVVENQADFLKYKGLAIPSSTAMSPTGRYRIKTRGSFGTGPAKTHSSKYNYDSWTISEVTIK